MTKETTTQTLQPGFKLQSKERIYEIIKVLGSGSFGITYLAISKVSIGNISMTMKFAIKEHFISASCYRGDDGATVLAVPTAKSDVMDSRADFITEANRLKKLCMKSRNIVSVNETFEANGTAYYVMEFLDGGRPSRCSEEEAISIAMQIANALDEIHKEHVLHLDIKPDNIVLKTNEKNETYPVLIDFGISKHFDSKGRPTSNLSAKGASPGFAPQEQYAGIREFSPKYDIYALGAVLFFLCTGKNPPDAFKISPNQQELKKELVGEVSSKVEKAILNAMKPAASERTPNVKRFCEDLMGIDFVPVLNVPYSQLDFSKDKNLHKVSVDSNIGWTVYADKDWCKIAKTDNIIVISVSKNKETGSRVGNVVISGSPYHISQVIHIKQEGSGTVVFPSGLTWWERNRKKVYQISSILLVGCIIIGGLCVLLRPNPEKESKILTEAIETMDGKTLKKYAEKDSIRAYLPFAQFLHEQGNREGSLQYANKAKALGNPTSLLAEELLTILNAEIDSVQPETPQEADNLQKSSATDPIEKTNEKKFARAANDFNLMLTLAKDNYAKAYYPLAIMYFDKNDYGNAKQWARKAINASVNSKQAQELLLKVESRTNDELFTQATTLEDFRALANKGYKKSYAPLAELYLKKHDYDNAHLWAVKAGKAKIGLAEARKVIKILDSYGYYDNGEHGGMPIF